MIQDKKITIERLKVSLPRFTNTIHKYVRGYLTAIVGSIEYPGSARLASAGALATGVGGVRVLMPESLWPLVGMLSPEIMVVLLKEHGKELTHASAFDAFVQANSKAKAVLLGCGLGRSAETKYFIKECLTHCDLPIVIDADAFPALCELPAETVAKHSKGRWILTPHGGELKQLLNAYGINDVTHDSIGQLARILDSVIVAKAMPSIIYCPNEIAYTNTTGNTAATTAGCGDVLAGVIAGFLAQGVVSVDAAVMGMFVAGKAADDIILARGGHSLLASEVIEQLPITLGRLY